VEVQESGLLSLFRGVENSGETSVENAFGIMERSHGPMDSDRGVRA
jgi:hypothetical protein